MYFLTFLEKANAPIFLEKWIIVGVCRGSKKHMTIRISNVLHLFLDFAVLSVWQCLP